MPHDELLGSDRTNRPRVPRRVPVVGDRVLPPGAAEVLCLRVELPSTVTEEAAAGRSVTAVLQVDAEQTAVNP